jgi:ABC-type Na+ efflux pump permease subunit
MKLLIGFSYLCAVFAILGFGLLAYDEIRWSKFWRDDDSFMLFLLIPPVLQMLYVRRISAVLHLPVFKQTRMLDEMAIQDGDMDVDIVGTNAFWQGVVVINSLMLSILVMTMTASLPYLLGDIFDGIQTVEKLALVMVMFAYIMAVPTIIFNLRTFSVKRIKARSDIF